VTYEQIQMNPKELSIADKGQFYSCLEYLKDLAPSDSCIKAEIFKDRNFFKGRINIKSISGEFSSEARSSTVQALTSILGASVEAQLNNWKSSRFEDVIHDNPLQHHFKKIKTALVVDDDIDMVRFISTQLKKVNCRVEVSGDGYDAMEKLTRKNYDLVIMDWSLPGLSGGEVLKRSDEAVDIDPVASEIWGVQKKPVVIVSGHNVNKLHFPLTEKFEIVDFWPKQIGPSALVGKVKNIVEKAVYN